MSHLKANALSYLAIAVMVALSLHYAERMPAEVAIHFGLDGRANGFGPRPLALWLFPGLCFLTTLALPMMISASPKGFQMANSESVIGRVNFALAAPLLMLHAGLILSNAAPQRYAMSPFLGAGLAALLLTLGNVMSKTERNYFIGIRTPSTLSSDEVWRTTHRHAGRLLVGSGLITLLVMALGGPTVAVGFVLLIASLAAAMNFASKLRKAEESSPPR